jgi:filamentous hemagglutinin
MFRNGPSSEAEHVIDANVHPESAQHAQDAIEAGKPDVITVDKGGNAARRRAAQKGTKAEAGKDRDEYPSVQGGRPKTGN